MAFHSVRPFVLLAAGLLSAAAALAGVVSKPQIVMAFPGKDLYIPLELQVSAGESIAALSGQMQFDPAYFSDPVVQAGNAVYGFKGVGNLTSPGKLRFVVYSDPTRAADLETPTMFVKLTAAADLPIDGSTTVTFLNGPIDSSNPDKPAESAVATTAGNAVSSVTFTTVQVVLNKNAASDWTLYP